MGRVSRVKDTSPFPYSEVSDFIANASRPQIDAMDLCGHRMPRCLMKYAGDSFRPHASERRSGAQGNESRGRGHLFLPAM